MLFFCIHNKSHLNGMYFMINMSWSNVPKQLEHIIKIFIVLMTFLCLSNHLVSGNYQMVKRLQRRNVGSNITIEVTSQRNVQEESVYENGKNEEVESSTFSLRGDVRYSVVSSVKVTTGIQETPSSDVQNKTGVHTIPSSDLQTKTPTTKTSQNIREGVKISRLEDTDADEPSKSTSSKPSNSQGLQEFQETLQRLRKMGQDFAKQALKRALPTMIRLISEIRISASCSGSLFKLAVGIRKVEEWAIKMLDSCGKIPAGILHGTLGELGDYEQCQDIVVYSQRDNSKERFRGQYCSISIQPYLPSGVKYHVYTSNKTVHELEEMYAFLSRGSFRLGICLPSSCSVDDVQQMANQVRKRVKLNVTVSSCQVKDSVWHLDSSQLVVCSFHALMLAIVLLGTVIELSRRYFQRRRNCNVKDRAETCFALQAIESFSAYGNTQYQLSTRFENNHLRVVDGIRVITITWIILGEIYQSMEPNQTGALQKIFNLREDFSFQLVIQFPFALDTLFFTSGLLITYIALKKLKKNNGQFNLWRYYIHRYWKLTPTFVIISGCIWLIEDLGSGPVWKENIDPLVKSCKKNWWTNVFYISNFLKVQDRCFPHCGFISCLMQFFFISPVIFLVLYRKPVIGKSFILTGILVSAMVLAIITPLLNQMPVLLASVADHSVQMEFLHLVITMPYTHLGTYCVGMATGYLIYTYNEKKLRMHPVLVVFGWIVAITCNMAIVFGLYQWNSNNSLPNKVTATVYAAFSRIGWSLGLAWLTIACLYGYGGIINSFLSWKGFTPLSRMTYVVYIIQPAWIGVFRSHLRSTLYYSNIFVTYIFIAYVTISYIMGFLVVLIYQTPFLNLEKLVLSRTTNEKQDSVEEEKHIGTQTSA